jgi:hypothetical protein
LAKPRLLLELGLNTEHGFAIHLLERATGIIAVHGLFETTPLVGLRRVHPIKRG